MKREQNIISQLSCLHGPPILRHGDHKSRWILREVRPWRWPRRSNLNSSPTSWTSGFRLFLSCCADCCELLEKVCKTRRCWRSSGKWKRWKSEGLVRDVCRGRKWIEDAWMWRQGVSCRLLRGTSRVGCGWSEWVEREGTMDGWWTVDVVAEVVLRCQSNLVENLLLIWNSGWIRVGLYL